MQQYRSLFEELLEMDSAGDDLNREDQDREKQDRQEQLR